MYCLTVSISQKFGHIVVEFPIQALTGLKSKCGAVVLSRDF